MFVLVEGIFDSSDHYSDRYKKEPTEANALNLLTGARANFKVSKENYKKLITIMNLVDEEGNAI